MLQTFFPFCWFLLNCNVYALIFCRWRTCYLNLPTSKVMPDQFVIVRHQILKKRPSVSWCHRQKKIQSRVKRVLWYWRRGSEVQGPTPMILGSSWRKSTSITYFSASPWRQPMPTIAHTLSYTREQAAKVIDATNRQLGDILAWDGRSGLLPRRPSYHFRVSTLGCS